MNVSRVPGRESRRAAVVTLFFTSRLALRALERELGAAAVVIVLGLGSPLLLYAGLHFQHTVGAMLVVGVFLALASAKPPLELPPLVTARRRVPPLLTRKRTPHFEAEVSS